MAESGVPVELAVLLGVVAFVGLLNQWVLIRVVLRLTKRVEDLERSIADGSLLGRALEGLGKWLMARLKDKAFNAAAGTLLAWLGGAAGQGLAKVLGLDPGATTTDKDGNPVVNPAALPKKLQGPAMFIQMIDRMFGKRGIGPTQPTTISRGGPFG